MSLRMVCDSCGVEITNNAVSNRLKRRLGRFEVEIMVATDGTWNTGHLCAECVIWVVKKGKPVEKVPA